MKLRQEPRKALGACLKNDRRGQPRREKTRLTGGGKQKAPENSIGKNEPGKYGNVEDVACGETNPSKAGRVMCQGQGKTHA